MTVSVRYIGTSRPYFETGVTGKQTSWYPGEAAAVPDDDAALLLATGVFEYGETAGGKSANDNRTLPSFATAVVRAATVVTTWANRAAAQSAGFAFFTNVGVGDGSYWYYSGGRWRPYGGRVTLKSLTTDVSNNGAPKIVMDYATILAGVWQDGDIIVADIVKERTGGTADTDATDVLLGTAPTTLGTTLNLSTSSLATTAISLALEYRWRRVSSTSVRSQSVAGAVGFGSSTSANSLITGLPNLDSTDTYLQVSSDLTTAGGEVAWLRGYNVTLIAGA